MQFDNNNLHNLTTEILKAKYDLKNLSVKEIYVAYNQIYNELYSLYKTRPKKGMNILT